MSLPSRERGLKSEWLRITNIFSSSLPSRERGLKFKDKPFLHRDYAVAPFAGAWIEIISFCLKMAGSNVAPFAGAWIEI